MSVFWSHSDRTGSELLSVTQASHTGRLGLDETQGRAGSSVGSLPDAESWTCTTSCPPPACSSCTFLAHAVFRDIPKASP